MLTVLMPSWPSLYGFIIIHAKGTAHFVKTAAAAPRFPPTQMKIALQAASKP